MPYLPPAIVGLQVFGFQNSISPYGWCSFWRFLAAWERSLGPRPIFKIQRKCGFPSKPRFSDLPHDEQLIETCSLIVATWWRMWPSVGPLQGSGTWVVNVDYLITHCTHCWLPIPLITPISLKDHTHYNTHPLHQLSYPFFKPVFHHSLHPSYPCLFSPSILLMACPFGLNNYWRNWLAILSLVILHKMENSVAFPKL